MNDSVIVADDGQDTHRVEESKADRSRRLIQLALDLLAGRVFTNANIPEGEPELLFKVFLPLGAMGREKFSELVDGDVDMFYQYMDQALPMGVTSASGDSLPVFGAVRYLTEEDMKKVRGYMDRISKTLQDMREEEEEIYRGEDGKDDSKD